MLVATLLCLPVAHASHDPRRLSELVENGEHAEAYELASEVAAEHAGDPRFDFYYGVAAIENDAVNEGIFALERVLIARPGADRVRLELARGYFIRGDDRRARREFETVRAHGPPADVAARIDRYLLAIQRRADRYETTVSGFLELGGGYDSNANSATADDSVDTVLGPPAVVPSSSQETSDSFGRLEGRFRVSHPVAPEVNLIGEAGGRGRFYSDEDQFNTGTVDGRFGALLRRPDWQLQGTLNTGRFYLDGDDYRDQAGVSGAYQLSLAERSTASLSLDVVEFDYATRDVLDSTLWILGGGLTHTLRLEQRPTLSTRVFFGAEDADDDSTQAQADAERDIVGVQAGLRMWVNPEWTFRGRMEARLSEYEEAGVLFSDARDEEYYRLDLAFDWRPDARWRIGPHLRVASNQSNNDLYEYDRTELELRARYDFH